MGMAVGSLFVKNHFNHESKAVALEMIHGIRESFNELLMENHWMDDATRLVAPPWTAWRMGKKSTGESCA